MFDGPRDMGHKFDLVFRPAGAAREVHLSRCEMVERFCTGRLQGHMLSSDATKLAELVAHFKTAGGSNISAMPSTPKQRQACRRPMVTRTGT